VISKTAQLKWNKKKAIPRAIPKHKRISRLKKQADLLFSEYIRKRDGKCMYCGKKENLQCSHVYGRRWEDGRWDCDNAITLCAGCHLYRWHSGEYQVQMHEWFMETFADEWSRISKKHGTIVKAKTEEELIEIRDNLKMKLNEVSHIS